LNLGEIVLPFFKTYLELLDTLHRDFTKAIDGLPTEALDWVPGEDMNSLCVLVVHTTGATRYWIGDVAGGIPSNRDRAAEFSAHGLDAAALKQRFADTLAFARNLLEKFRLEDLDKQCLAPLQGDTRSAGWALFHALEHTALHMGHAQITRQLWDQRQT
jgi:hypothetical protein